MLVPSGGPRLVELLPFAEALLPQPACLHQASHARSHMEQTKASATAEILFAATEIMQAIAAKK